MNLSNIALEQFNQLDIAIVNMFWNKVTGVRAISKALKISPNDIVTSIKKLKQLGVIEELL